MHFMRTFYSTCMTAYVVSLIVVLYKIHSGLYMNDNRKKKRSSLFDTGNKM